MIQWHQKIEKKMALHDKGMNANFAYIKKSV
jgi:hypothetical protein